VNVGAVEMQHRNMKAKIQEMNICQTPMQFTHASGTAATKRTASAMFFFRVSFYERNRAESRRQHESADQRVKCKRDL